MIVSRYLSEPEAHDPVSTPHAGSESFLSKVWRAVRRAVPLRLPSLGAARQPFQRLDFWTASHPLSFKLRLYSVTEPKISMWQGFTWETLRYWQDLMSGEETDVPGYAGSLTAYASDLFMASDIQYLNEINAAKLVQLGAEPYSE